MADNQFLWVSLHVLHAEVDAGRHKVRIESLPESLAPYADKLDYCESKAAEPGVCLYYKPHLGTTSAKIGPDVSFRLNLENWELSPMASFSAPPAAELSPLEQCLAFKLSVDEYNARFTALEELYKDVSDEERTFTFPKQLRCINELNEHEYACLTNFFQCVEANEWSMAFTLIDKLYKCSAMANEPLGLLAFVTASVSTHYTPMASVVRHATPFSRVQLDDWAYYIALARLKLDHDQPAHAHSWMRLAKLVPHHHPGIVSLIEYEISLALAKTRYAAPRTIPNFVKHHEIVLKTFRDADQIRDSVVKEIPHFEKATHRIEALREENYNLQRVLSRAEARYYINNWQYLDNPEPQPASIWSRLPESVLSHMACIVNWKEYLQLASTCKLYNNRMNSSRIWQTVLEKKWDLDLTCFDEAIPRNPVVIVQQIHHLFYLESNWFARQMFKAPMYEYSYATERALTAAPHNIFHRSLLSEELPAEVIWRLFMSVIAADKSGNLTAQLIENGILDYVINTLRTDSMMEHVELAMDVLALLYVRSRRTCALVSRYLPPNIAVQLLLSKTFVGDDHETACGVMAAALASYVLFPDAHDMSLPSLAYDKRDEPYRFQVSDLSEVSKPRPGDFQAALVDAAYASLHRAGYIANDPWDLDLQKELEVDKRRFNLDFRVKLATAIEYGPEAIVEAEGIPTADVNLLRSYREAFIASSDYERIKNEEEEQDENPEAPRHFDEQHAALLETNGEAVDRFAAADAQWQLFITLPGVACASNVLHRGLMRLTMDKSDSRLEEDEDYDIHGSGYWTIGAEETPVSMAENAIFSNGPYDATFVGHQHEPGRESATAKEHWKKEHAFEFAAASISDAGAFIAIIERDDKTMWTLEGAGFILGYHGSISCGKNVGNDEEDEEEEDGEDDDEDESELIGGWILLKPEFADLSAVGKEDLNAYERLANLSVRVGPLAYPEHAPYPQAWEDTPEEEADNITIDDKMRDTGSHAGMLASACVNSLNFNNIITHNSNDYAGGRPDDFDGRIPMVLRYLFVPDIHREFYASTWRSRRLSVAYDLFFAVDLMRHAVVCSSREEVESDRLLLQPFCGSTEAEVECFERIMDPAMEIALLNRTDDQMWKAALLAHFKWAARLSLFEVAGMDNLRAMRFTYLILQGMASEEDDEES